jgi:hypothetical protein
VQWEENLVQVLLTGRYLQYNDEEFGNPITNWELNQLKQAGLIAHYDDDFVHLQQQTDASTPSDQRSYYLNTTLPRDQVKRVEEALASTHLNERFSVRMHERYIIIRAENGIAFDSFDAAENAREMLLTYAPEVFAETVVAFVEIVTT